MNKSSFLFTVLISLLLMACSNANSTDTKRWANGKYTGDAFNYGGNITATVTVRNHRISKVTIEDLNGTPAQYAEPYSIVSKRIIKSQSVDVDGISGATYSSNAVKYAVAQALEKQALTNQ